MSAPFSFRHRVRLAQTDAAGVVFFTEPLAIAHLAWEALLDELGQQIELVVLMELDDALLVQRLLSRGRADDNEAVIRHRLEVYRQQTEPLIAYYRERGLLAPVEAAGSVEAIGDRIASLLS